MNIEPISNRNDILEQYCNISNKLKKRFLRKPNVTEGCDAFNALGQQCESIELQPYAGLCWIAAARCEGSLSNLPGETSCLIRAARQFLLAEQNDCNLNCSSPSKENLQAALSCYEHAASKYPENSTIPISLNMEIVDFLKKIDKKHYIEHYLNNSIELSLDNSDTRRYCLRLLVTHFIETGNYVAALDTLTEITTILDIKQPTNGAKCEELLYCEISRVLLLLILRTVPQKLSPHLAKLLEKYTWGDQNDKTLQACQMPEKLFLLLQSLVTICQSLDTSNLIDLEGELWLFLTNEQKELLRILVRIYYP